MRALALCMLLVGLIAGCSDSTPPPSHGGSKVAPVNSDGGSGKGPEPLPTVSDEKAIAVLDAAVKAHGGSATLGRASVMERRVKGTLTLPGVGDRPFTGETTYQLPDQYRNVVTIELPNGKNSTTVVINGDKGWRTDEMVGTTELAADARREIRDDLYVLAAISLLPLKKDGTILTLLPEEKVDDKPADVVRATRKEHPELVLYFDHASHLLVKIERRAVAKATSAVEVLLSEHKDFDGLKMPGRQQELRGGTRVVDCNITSMRFPAHIDAGLFAKP